MSDEEEKGEIIDGIIEKVMTDPNLLKKAEEYQKKYGTMTEKDLRRAFTI